MVYGIKEYYLEKREVGNYRVKMVRYEFKEVVYKGRIDPI